MKTPAAIVFAEGLFSNDKTMGETEPKKSTNKQAITTIISEFFCRKDNSNSNAISTILIPSKQ